MKLIAHRGNIIGPDNSIENNPIHIDEVIKLGFDVEIDLNLHDGKYYLGHDTPQYLIDSNWLIARKNNLWVHLKTLELANFDFIRELNYFWHENDKMTLTSNGTPWCYPGIYIPSGITVVLTDEIVDANIYGVCTDYPQKYKGIYDEKCIN